MKKDIENSDLSIFNSVIDYAIMITDGDRNIISWNRGAEKSFGYRENEVIGKKVDMLFTPEDRNNNEHIKEIETARREGRAADERWHLRKDGSRFYVSGVLTRINEKSESRFIKIARDLTERKNNEEAVHLADKRKNEFLATLSHELRNPLASIYSGLEILKQEREDKNRTEILNAIDRQVMQIVHLVDDLLEISRITQGKIKLQKEYINLIDAVQQAIESVKPILDSNKHHFTLSLPQEPLVVYADVTRLSQIFLNILVNAIKYTKVEGMISLTAEKQNDKAILRIRDNGLGIPKHMLKKIFEMFTQIERSDERPQAGLGIGLSVVKQLVEMHDGTVEAFSEGENSGSEFVVTLPLSAKENLHEAESKIESDQKSLLQVSFNRKKVLIIDDNKDAADMMHRLLKKRGYPVDISYTGKKGLDKVREFNPDVILLDIGLPDISGFDVAKEVRQLQVPCYIIGISGWGQEEDRIRSQQAGFDHHLVKPVEFNTIVTLLNSFP